MRGFTGQNIFLIKTSQSFIKLSFEEIEPNFENQNVQKGIFPYLLCLLLLVKVSSVSVGALDIFYFLSLRP